MVALDAVGGVDGDTAQRLAQADRLIGAVHVSVGEAVGAVGVARVHPAGHRRLDIGHRHRPGDVAVVVVRLAQADALGIADPTPVRTVLGLVHLAVEQIAPLGELEQSERRHHPQGGHALELVGAHRADVLDAPAVVGVQEAVSAEHRLIGIEHHVDGQVAVDMTRHLHPVGGDRFEMGLEVLGGEVQRLGAGVQAHREMGVAHRFGVEIRERRRDGAEPRGAIGEDLVAGLGEDLGGQIAAERFGGVGFGELVIGHHAHRQVVATADRLVTGLQLGHVTGLGCGGDADFGHLGQIARPLFEGMAAEVAEHRLDHGEHRRDLIGGAEQRAVIGAAVGAAVGIGRGVVQPTEFAHGGGRDGRLVLTQRDDRRDPIAEDLVHLGHRRERAAVQQLIEAEHHDAGPRRRLGGGPFAHLDDAVPIGDHPRRDVDRRGHGGHARQQRVGVDVDESGHQHRIAEIDHLGIGCGRSALLGAADGGDAAVFHHHRLGAGVGVVDGQDRA